MKRNLFWGLALLLIGLVLLLDNLGYLAWLGVSVWQLIWPLTLISLGVWVLWSAAAGKTELEARELFIPAEGAKHVALRIDYGAGEFFVTAGAPLDAAVRGSFEGGVEEQVTPGDEQLRVRLDSPSLVLSPWSWGPNTRRRWHVELNPTLGYDLRVETGASDGHLDLSDLQVKRLHIESGASSTDVKLPSQAGHTDVKGASGAASLTFHVPEGVAARIRASGGLSSIDVNQTRFPRHGDVYQSPDYESAANTVDMRLDIGVGSITVN